VEAGDTLGGRYRLIARLGEGGMGEVWRAEQLALGREVAVKRVREALDGDEARARFEREAALVARVQHRNVVDILDYGDADGAPFLVMPLLSGETLHARLARGLPPLGDVLSWARGVLGGLAAIHEAGIVHRDLKPANVFLAEDGDGVIPKLLDFGISRAAKRTGPHLTAPHTSVGTPCYMAPEQFESARDVDARADVWAAGVILYEALAGRRPFEGDDAFAVHRATLQTEPAPLDTLRPDLPRAIVELVHRALRRDAAERFASGAAMRDALDAATGALPATDPPAVPGTIGLAMASPTEALPSPRRRGRAAIGIAAAGALGLATLLVLALALASPEPPRAELAPAAAEPAPPPDAGPAAETARPPAPTPAPPSGVRVTGARPLEALASDWAELPSSLRELPFRFTRLDDGWAARLPAETPPAALERAMRALGSVVSAPEAYDPSVGLRPARMSSTVRLTLRRTPTTDAPNVLRVLPHDTVVVALHESGDSDEGFLQVVVSRRQRGWVTARFLAPLEGCVPSRAAILDESLAYLEEVYGGEVYDELEDEADDVFGQAERAAEESLAVRTRIWSEGRPRSAFLLITPDVYGAAEIVAYALDAECELERLTTHRLGGALGEVFLTETLRGGGQTLLVASHAPRDSLGADGILQWSATPLHRRREVWSAQLPTAESLPDHRRGSVSGTRDRAGRARREPFALVVRRPGEERQWWIWQGDRLVLEEGDAPPAEEGEAPPG